MLDTLIQSVQTAMTYTSRHHLANAVVFLGIGSYCSIHTIAGNVEHCRVYEEGRDSHFVRRCFCCCCCEEGLFETVACGAESRFLVLSGLLYAPRVRFHVSFHDRSRIGSISHCCSSRRQFEVTSHFPTPSSFHRTETITQTQRRPDH